MASGMNIEDYQIGSFISCDTIWNESVSGYLCAYNEEKTQVILETEASHVPTTKPKLDALYSLSVHGAHSIRILSLSSVSKITLIHDIKPEDSHRLAQILQLSSTSVDSKCLDARVSTSLAQLKENRRRLNTSVSDSAQLLFNQLNNMFGLMFFVITISF